MLSGIMRAGRIEFRQEMNDYVLRTNGWTQKDQFLHAYVCLQDTFVTQFSFKPSTSFIFIFNVNDSNRVCW